LSDALWDQEYYLAGEIEQEIRDYCLEKEIKCPIIKEFARSWELKLILDKLKKENEYEIYNK